MGLALYREFRPKTFEEVVGQNHITKTLANQVKNNNITHAYLFTGARGTGKTSCAKIFSRAINCLNNKNGSPCGECANCKALSDINTDIMEIDAASNNRVDEIRDLREMVKYPPIIGKKKVYIIDEVHMLTESAFNALLKTLEEPPEFVVFILATTEVHKLPATILSRCTRFDFRLLSVEELVGQLKKVFDLRKIEYDNESLYVIARQGEGSVRDTLSIADSVLAYSENKIEIEKTLQVLGLSSTSAITNIVKSIGNNDIKGLFVGVKQAITNGKNITVLCKELTEYFKNLILIKNNIDDFSILDIMPNDVESYKEVASLFSCDKLKLAFEKLSKIELDLKFSLNPQNLLQSICVSLIDEKKDNNFEEKPKIVENVEKTSITQNYGKNRFPQNQEYEKNNIISNNQEESEIAIVSQENTINEEQDAGVVWGKVLIKVKEKNMFAFSATIKNIYGVEVKNGKLILKTNDKSVFNSVDEPEKKELLLNILKEINANVQEITVVYDESNKSKQDIINNLKNTFLDKIKIKE